MPGGRSACGVHRTQDRSPAQQQNPERDGGHEDEDWSGAPTGGQPQQHAHGDCAQPDHRTGSEAGRVAPRPGHDVTREAAREERPGGAQHADKVIRLAMATATDDGEDQYADDVHGNRRPDLHAGPHYAGRMAEHADRGGSTDQQPKVSVQRVMGIETEYGISALNPPTEDDLHPMQLSNHVVKAYGASVAGQPAGWDYETETPLRDIRGYELSRSAAHPDQLTDSDLGMANVILSNGARLYVDHAHPEYSGPEVTSALDVVRFDKAGDAVMAIAAQRASLPGPLGPSLQEQHRRQGCLVRHPRELPARPEHAVRPDRRSVHGLSGVSPGHHRGRPSGPWSGQPG